MARRKGRLLLVQRDLYSQGNAVCLRDNEGKLRVMGNVGESVTDSVEMILQCLTRVHEDNDLS